ncbi:MAG: serine/threonine protein kinase [Phycisphaerae bacterium]|nr:serine/threonine protein kinase [Phycisphaerae bacterium]
MDSSAFRRFRGQITSAMSETPNQPVPIPPPSPGDGPPGDTRMGEIIAKRQIPGFQILERLGAGGMAVVFKARQLSLNRVVAIKVLPRRLSNDAEYVERFYAEGRAAAKLNHPNIVQAIDVSEYAGYHYFVMEYVEGRTVHDELEKGKVYFENEALNIILQIGGALEHAHAQGLIHRDVKPKNIMITPDGTAKLMDMGLARLADDARAIQTEAGKLYGTPYYISPEQILGRTNIDSRCDIYSLGATLYHMVAGRVPFEGRDAKEIMIKHVKQKLISPDRYNMDLSFGLVKVILKMMAKRRRHRYATTAEMMDDLRSVDFLLEVQDADDGTALSGLGRTAEEYELPPIPPPPPPKTTSLSTAGRGKSKFQKSAYDVPPPQLILPKTNRYLLLGLILSVILNIAMIVLLLMRK